MSNVINSKDFSTIKPFAFWTQHVLPLVYGDEISYMETLDKVVKLLNELIKNNNKLPDYIQQIVEEYITGGPLEEVLSGILANFILNVKYPPTGITPAKGDGTANDYEAIQGCIDYAANKGGGVVYFPFGKYLTSKLTLKPGVSLMGFGKYCTSIVLTGGETGSLISGTVNGCGIYNLTLDGNMSIQVNDVDVITLTGYDIQLMNVILTDGYTLFNIEKTGDNIEVNNVEFRYAVESMLRIGGNVGSVNANSVTFGSLSTIKGVAAIISDSDNDVITGIVSNKVLPLFAELDGNNNVLKGKVASTNLISGDGQGNVYDFYCRAKNETYSGDVGETVHGNKSVHISGMSTWTVDNNSTESVDGNKSSIVTGETTETYHGKTNIGTNDIDNLSGKKVINAKDIVLNPENPLTYRNSVIKNNKHVVETLGQDGTPVNLLTDENETGIIVNNETVKSSVENLTEGSGETPVLNELEYTKNIIKDRNERNASNIIRVISANWPTKSFITKDAFIKKNYKDSIYSLLRLAPDVVGTCENQENQKYQYADYATNEYLPYAYYKNLRTINLDYTAGYDAYVWIDGGYGGEGNGVISVLPLSETSFIRLPAQGTETATVYWSGASYANINFKGTKVRIYSYHGNYLSPEFAKNDILRFAEILKNDTTPNIILVGDWNLDYLTSPDGYTPLLNAGFSVVNKNKPTFPYNAPVSVIDNVFIKGTISISDYGVSAPINPGLVGEGNDHLFVWADLKIGG